MRVCQTADVVVNAVQERRVPQQGAGPPLGSARPSSSTGDLGTDLYGVLELAVCLQKFVNLEMRSQGWYAVRVKLLPNPRIKAVWTYTHALGNQKAAQHTRPWNLAGYDSCKVQGLGLFHTDEEAGMGRRSVGEATGPGMDSTGERGWSWRSQVFRVQYCYDQCNFKNAVPCFQVFVRQPQHMSTLDLTVRLELVAQMLAPEQLDAVCVPSKLRPVASEVIRLRGAAGGLLAYHPASWGIDFWGLCHVLLSTCLVGFATRASMHSMGWAVGRDLRRPRGGAPRRRRQLSLLHVTGSHPSLHPLALPYPTSSSSPGDGGSHHALVDDAGVPVPDTAPSGAHAENGSGAGGDAGSYGPGSGNGVGAGHGAGVRPLERSAGGKDDAPLRPVLSMGSPLSFSSVRSGNSGTMSNDASVHSGSGGGAGGSGGGGAVTLLEALQAHVTAVERAECGCTDPSVQGHTLPAPVRTCVDRLYRDLVMPLQSCTQHLASMLCMLPTSCYAPQTYETMKALVKDVPAASHRAFSSATAHLTTGNSPTGSPRRGHHYNDPFGSSAPQMVHARLVAVSAGLGLASHSPPSHSVSHNALAVGHSPSRFGPGSNHVPYRRTAGGSGCSSYGNGTVVYNADVVAADVSSWDEVPGPVDFMASLPPDCGTGGAVLYLHATLTRVMREAATEWGLLQWLMETGSRQLARCLRCHWEMEQPLSVAPWVMAMSDLPPVPRATPSSVRGMSVAHSADRARTQMIARPPSNPPQVARTAVWDRPLEQPLLLLDDSLAPHMMAVFKETESAHRLSVSDMESAPTAMQQASVTSLVTPRSRVDRALDGGVVVREIHLVVFVHGYQGAPTDLGPIKAHLHALYPTLDCKFSSANEGKTDDMLEVMGERLAGEILKWITALTQDNGHRHSRLGRLSFVGHSLGAVIVRAALANSNLTHLLPHLWLLISIGAPHLGQLYNNNGLLSAGLGVLKAIKKGGCLQQLDLSDTQRQDPSTAWLYRLATAPQGSGGTLQAFKRVVLLACEQDRYVPTHSAELSWCEAALKDKGWKGKAYADMLNASTMGFGVSSEAPQLLRVGVHFPARVGPSASVISDVLGRTAHIALIESDEVARLVAWGIVKRFQLFEPEVNPPWI